MAQLEGEEGIADFETVTPIRDDRRRGIREGEGASSRFVPTERHQYRRAQVFRMPFKNFNATEKEFIAT